MTIWKSTQISNKSDITQLNAEEPTVYYGQI